MSHYIEEGEIPISTVAWIFGLLAIILAGLTSGLTGFGFALVSVPLLVTILPPKQAIVVVTLLSHVTHLLIIAETWRSIHPRRIWRLVIAGIIGTPLGTYLLIALNADLLKGIIGGVTVLAALAMLAGFQRPIRNERLAGWPVGFLSGLLTGSTAMGGPPVILFFSNQGVEKQIFRANLTFFFTLTSLAALPGQITGGLIDTPTLTAALIFTPALLLGTAGGIALARRVSESLFRRVTLIVIGLTGLSALTGALSLF